MVIDTSTFISATITSGTTAAILDAIYAAEHKLLFSLETYEELYEVLGRSKFDRYIDREDRLNLLETVIEFAEWVTVVSNVRACRDLKDDKFLAVALDGKADYVISSDRDLCDLKRFEDIPILAPREFHDIVLTQ